MGKVQTIYATKPRGEDRQIEELVTSEAWKRAFEGYAMRARGHAANLAAHNWAVTAINGRILLTCDAYGGSGHWLDPDGKQEAVTAEEAARVRGIDHAR